MHHCILFEVGKKEQLHIKGGMLVALFDEDPQIYKTPPWLLGELERYVSKKSQDEEADLEAGGTAVWPWLPPANKPNTEEEDALSVVECCLICMFDKSVSSAHTM